MFVRAQAQLSGIKSETINLTNTLWSSDDQSSQTVRRSNKSSISCANIDPGVLP